MYRNKNRPHLCKSYAPCATPHDPMTNYTSPIAPYFSYSSYISPWPQYYALSYTPYTSHAPCSFVDLTSMKFTKEMVVIGKICFIVP